MTASAQTGLLDVARAASLYGTATASDLGDVALSLFRDVVTGLRENPKTLPCKYLYDARGSELFERICETPEYYVTRTELELLRVASPVVASAVGARVNVLEPGSGAGEKIRLLLDALDAPRSYTPVDISPSALWPAAKALGADYPGLAVTPLVADFTSGFPRPESFSAHGGARLIFFPGSTIGNFVPDEAEGLLRQMGELLRSGDWLFIGVDRLKDAATLEAAYDDAAGVTAEFNLNLLFRIRRELPTDLVPHNFRHEARFNAKKSRVEMHLVSRAHHTVRVGRARFDFSEGESIHTESSHKYTVDGFSRVAQKAGFELEQVFSDRREFYSLYLCRWRG